MNDKRRRNRFTLIGLMIILAAALLIFGIFEYRLFSRIAREEYEKTRNSLVLSVNRTAGREMQNISMMGRWFDQAVLLAMSGNSTIEEEIPLIYENFGLDSETPILSRIGYVEFRGGSWHEYRYDGKSWEPVGIDPVVGNIMSEWVDHPVIRYVDDQLIYLTPAGLAQAIVSYIDMEDFNENYIYPAVVESHPELEIVNTFTSDDPEYARLIGDDGDVILNRYQYNPFTALFSDPYIMQENLILPSYSLIFEIFNDDSKGFKVFGRMGEDDPDRIMEGFWSQDVKRTFFEVKISNMQYFGGNIERTLSIIFIGGILLIGLIGCICVLLLYQMNRNQRQREKEREFTASITHELRTPLTVIQSASDNLASNKVPEKRIPAYGDLIRQQTHRLGNMIENILVYSRVEGNKSYKRQESVILLDEFFDRIRLQSDALGGEKDIPIQWSFKNLDVRIQVDAELLELVVSNLISNSIYHAYPFPSGDIRVSVCFSRPDTLICSIEDDGVGIPMKEQKQIWDPYYRGEKSKSSQERGTGLGLFIVKKNVSILGGEVNLDSPYPRLDGIEKSGCRFDLTIPCKVIEDGKDTDH